MHQSTINPCDWVPGQVACASLLELIPRPARIGEWVLFMVCQDPRQAGSITNRPLCESSQNGKGGDLLKANIFHSAVITGSLSSPRQEARVSFIHAGQQVSEFAWTLSLPSGAQRITWVRPWWAWSGGPRTTHVQHVGVPHSRSPPALPFPSK